MNPELEEILWEAFREHTDKHLCRRVVPPTLVRYLSHIADESRFAINGNGFFPFRIFSVFVQLFFIFSLIFFKQEPDS